MTSRVKPRDLRAGSDHQQVIDVESAMDGRNLLSHLVTRADQKTIIGGTFELLVQVPIVGRRSCLQTYGRVFGAEIWPTTPDGHLTRLGDETSRRFDSSAGNGSAAASHA